MSSPKDSQNEEEQGAASMRDLPRCVDCNAVAPPNRGNFTLIGSAFGWRLTRAANGARKMEWRCPTCFARVKKRTG